MKKVVQMAMCFLFGVALISLVNIINIKEYNRRLKIEIKGNEMNNLTLKNEIAQDEKQIEALKIDKKDKWEELSTWKNIESKIQKALSN